MKFLFLSIIFVVCYSIDQWTGDVNLVDLSKYTNPQSSFYQKCHKDGVKT